MKLRKRREVWVDSDNVTHLPQLSGDDHTLCGIASDEDYNGLCMDVMQSTSFTCKECERILNLYKTV